MTGLMINIGGLTESLVRHATDSFSDFVNQLPCQLCPELPLVTPQTILEVFAEVFVTNMGNERITIPLLETLDIYLSMGYLLSVNDPASIKTVFNCLKKEVGRSVFDVYI
jgi:hypothetical protein